MGAAWMACLPLSWDAILRETGILAQPARLHGSCLRIGGNGRISEQFDKRLLIGHPMYSVTMHGGLA